MCARAGLRHEARDYVVPAIARRMRGMKWFICGCCGSTAEIQGTDGSDPTLRSNPGGASGVYKIVPAVPSPSGVADVFAFQNDGTVQAITSDGTTAWTANVGCADGTQYPVAADFQGGLVAMQGGCNGSAPTSIVKFDGLSGQVTYTPSAPWSLSGQLLPTQVLAHTDGRP